MESLNLGGNCYTAVPAMSGWPGSLHMVSSRRRRGPEHQDPIRFSCVNTPVARSSVPHLEACWVGGLVCRLLPSLPSGRAVISQPTVTTPQSLLVAFYIISWVHM